MAEFEDLLAEIDQEEKMGRRSKSLWDWAMSPIPAVQEAMKGFSEDIGAASTTTDPGREFWKGDPIPRQARAALRGATAGFLEEAVPQFATPFDIATLPAGIGARALRGTGALGKGLYKAARGIEIGGGLGLGAEGLGDIGAGIGDIASGDISGGLSQVGGGLFRTAVAPLLLRGGKAPEFAAQTPPREIPEIAAGLKEVLPSRAGEVDSLIDEVVSGRRSIEDLQRDLLGEKSTLAEGEIGRGPWGRKTERRLGGEAQGPQVRNIDLAKRQAELLGDQPNPFAAVDSLLDEVVDGKRSLSDVSETVEVSPEEAITIAKRSPEGGMLGALIPSMMEPGYRPQVSELLRQERPIDLEVGSLYDEAISHIMDQPEALRLIPEEDLVPMYLSQYAGSFSLPGKVAANLADAAQPGGRIAVNPEGLMQKTRQIVQKTGQGPVEAFVDALSDSIEHEVFGHRTDPHSKIDEEGFTVLPELEMGFRQNYLSAKRGNFLRDFKDQLLNTPVGRQRVEKLLQGLADEYTTSRGGTIKRLSEIPPPKEAPLSLFEDVERGIDLTEKGAPPERRLRVNRGTHGAVDIQFGAVEDKELFSAIGRSRRKTGGKPGKDPNWEGLARWYGKTQKEIYDLAVEYRDSVMNAVKNLEENSVFNAPRPPGLESPVYKVPAVAGDKALGELFTKTFGQTTKSFGSLSVESPNFPERKVTTSTAGPAELETLRKRLYHVKNITKRQADEILQQAAGRPEKIGDLLRMADKPTAMQKGLEAWKMGLLSGPATWIVNMGDVVESAFRAGETAMGPLLDKVLKGPQVRFKGEAAAEVKGALSRAPEALQQVAKDLKDAALLREEKIDIDRPIEFQVGKIGGKTGRAVRIPVRVLGAVTDAIKVMGNQAELEKLAWRQASKEGAEDVALRAREIVKEALDPTNTKGSELIKEAASKARERVYQGEPGPLLDGLLRLRQKNPWLHVVLPFLETPGNITKMIVQRSPAGFAKAAKAYRNYKVALDKGLRGAELEKLKGEAIDAIARPLTGTLVMGLFGALAANGNIVGGGPTDKKQRNALLSTGWQPYSIRVGDTFVPFQRFQPVGALMGFAADALEAWELGNKEGASAAFEKGLDSVSANLTSQTYLQGLADGLDFASKPTEMAGTYASSLAGSLVPSIVGRTAQALDPIVRDTRPTQPGLAGVGERVLGQVQSRIPFASTALPPKMSVTGEPIERAGTALTRLISPSQPSRLNQWSEVINFMKDLDVLPGLPSRDVTRRGRKAQLTQDEWQDVVAGNTKALEYIQENYLEDERFRELPPERQAYYIKRVVQRFRSAAKRPFEGVIRQRIRENEESEI